jgi:hypothetical protein
MRDQRSTCGQSPRTPINRPAATGRRWLGLPRPGEGRHDHNTRRQSARLDLFSEGTRPTSIRSGIRQAYRAGRAAVRRPGPAPVRPARADRAPACPPCQCCPRQALRATPRCLTPRAESCPQSGEVGAAWRNRTDDLLITRRKLTVTSAVFRRVSLRGFSLGYPNFSSVLASSLHEWLHAGRGARCRNSHVMSASRSIGAHGGPSPFAGVLHSRVTTPSEDCGTLVTAAVPAHQPTPPTELTRLELATHGVGSRRTA